jgi:hypothetical protein
MKTKEYFIKAELNVDRLTPIQWAGILRAMENYAQQQVENWNTPVVTTSYLYLVDYKYSGGSGVYIHEKKILKFDSIEEITINNIKERVSGQKYSEYIIKKMTPL